MKAGAIPPEELVQPFPSIDLPIQPPYPPAEAKSVNEIPRGPGWLYEPKWDGFRCLAFRNRKEVLLQSKAGQPLGRYFPELVAALADLPERRFVLDGEIVIFSGGHLSFDDLLLLIHPAQSRIRKLSAESPATFMCFDLLVDSKGEVHTHLPLKQRRERLTQLFRHFRSKGTVRLSPASTDRKQAEQWMRELGTLGLDGIVAKRLDEAIGLESAPPWSRSSAFAARIAWSEVFATQKKAAVLARFSWVFTTIKGYWIMWDSRPASPENSAPS